MKELINTLLALFGKSAIKGIINSLASSKYFQDLVKGLILSRFPGIKEKQPEVYKTLEQYADLVSRTPAILTDDDPDNLSQVAIALRLQEIEDYIASVAKGTDAVTTTTRKVRLKIDPS